MARGDAPENRVVFEPTGPYHRAIERALGASGVPFVKVSPRQGRRFAEATGKLEKTDRLDAAILTRMGALLEWMVIDHRTARHGKRAGKKAGGDSQFQRFVFSSLHHQKGRNGVMA